MPSLAAPATHKSLRPSKAIWSEMTDSLDLWATCPLPDLPGHYAPAFSRLALRPFDKSLINQRRFRGAPGPAMTLSYDVHY
jgi:hypothetical protein